MPGCRFPALLVITVACLLGCSATRLAYDNLDWMAQRYADEYLELTRAQRRQWEPLLEVSLARHRSEQLPRIVRFLKATERLAADGLQGRELDCLWRELGNIYQANAALVIEALAPLLAALTSDQVEHLARKLAEDNEDYRSEYLSGERQNLLTERATRIAERIEFWTGSLEMEQLALIERRNLDLPQTAGPWLAYRIERQGKLLGLLRAGAGARPIAALLTSWWVNQDAQPANLRRGISELNDGLMALVREIDGTLSPVQRRRLLQRAGDMGEDLASILDGAEAAGGQGPIGLDCSPAAGTPPTAGAERPGGACPWGRSAACGPGA